MKAYIKTKPRFYENYTFFREVTNDKHPVDVVFKRTVSQDLIGTITNCTAEMIANIEVGAKDYVDKEGNTKASPVIYVNDVIEVVDRVSIKVGKPKTEKEDLPL